MPTTRLALMAGQRQFGSRFREWRRRQDEAARRRRARMWRAISWLPRWLGGRKRPGVVESALVVLGIGVAAQAAGVDGGLAMLAVIAVRATAVRLLRAKAAAANSAGELLERVGIRQGDEVDVVVGEGEGLTTRRR